VAQITASAGPTETTAMQSRWIEELEAMRQKLSRQNEQWTQAQELLAASGRAVPIPREFLEELDRVCDVSLRPIHARANIHNGAIRA